MGYLWFSAKDPSHPWVVRTEATGLEFSCREVKSLYGATVQDGKHRGLSTNHVLHFDETLAEYVDALPVLAKPDAGSYVDAPGKSVARRARHRFVRVK